MLERLERLFQVTRDHHKTVPALSGLRGFAVFLVFLSHYAAQSATLAAPGGVTSRVTPTLVEMGSVGVDIFFVLSGYLIYGALLRTSAPLRQFFKRRFVRIYPAFACVLALYVVLALLLPDQERLPDQVLPAILYVIANAALLPGIFDITPLITVAWSLSYEAFFYLVAPAWVYWLGMRSRTATIRIAALGVLAVSGLLVAGWLESDRLALVMFVGGMLVYELEGRARRTPTVPISVAAASAGLLIPILAALDAPLAIRLGMLLLACTLLVVHALGSRTLTARLLSVAPVRWLGNMSYSYYLLHGLTLKAFFALTGGLLPAGPGHEIWFWGVLPVAWAVTVIPSLGLFLLVEKRYSFPTTRQPSTAASVAFAAPVGAGPEKLV